MRRVTHVRVEGLFGHLRHDIPISASAPTILTGPNGAGKTHVLMLLRAALIVDLKTLFKLPYTEFEVQFSDNHQLQIRRAIVKDEPELEIAALKGGKADGRAAKVRAVDFEEPDLPRHIIPLPDGRLYDSRIERTLSAETAQRRYGPLIITPRRRFNNYPAIVRMISENAPILIDTKRLDAALPGHLQSDIEGFHSNPTERALASSSIGRYIGQIRIQVTEARRASVQATQSADLSFAARALAAASDRIKEDPLHQRYDAIVDRYEDLARNGLAIGEAPLSFPEKTTPTVRRILNVFLDDWERRLKPLLPVNEKIKTLRDILDTKLAKSGKRTAMAARGQLVFQSFATGQRVRVANLSSGEQHLVALFTLLLFTANGDSLVLIDEPEISMHAAWKHAFLDDISRVALLTDLQIIVATHSTAIINGRWDLTQELGFSDGPYEFHGEETADDTSLDPDELLA
ncbi:hypothetical protein E1263_20895 [Kribbella antibiotica]|uniref:ATPase AAA-type core domain-containing protein n=1 Tax=Kribbella antibiotica TaxID=190195 RepID=A0A4V2YPI1_9ACTN|nr:AAA family ATPase [Kribbella antibiotica]TDD58017.1 hypothetical protein E1263_20895 [Kribbella antibiotica]